jgi:uncharacterized protein (DUF433 family)/DNA-binding transcriptional MerR regulator
MTYSKALASVLTGATPFQLGYWSRRGLLVPEVSNGRPPIYSFRDLVALRSMVFLRSHTSFQRIGTAFSNLDLMDLTEHPSKYKFATDGKTIIVDPGDGSGIDLVKKPGQRDSFTFDEIMDSFKDFKDREVVDFRRPSEHVELNFSRLGGWPTVAGTRIPYDLVANLVDHKTIFEDDVPDYFPSVSADAARDVVAFDQKVKAVGVA